MLTLTAKPPPDPEAQARARHAATEYLRLAGADPAACWAQIERLGIGGSYDPRLARIWQQAESAAVVAAYGSWRRAPLSVWLDWEADA
jgi:hypothetical protein